MSATFKGIRHTVHVPRANGNDTNTCVYFTENGSATFDDSIDVNQFRASDEWKSIKVSWTDGGTISLNGNNETRPDNFTVRIWKRTA